MHVYRDPIETPPGSIPPEAGILAHIRNAYMIDPGGFIRIGLMASLIIMALLEIYITTPKAAMRILGSMIYWVITLYLLTKFHNWMVMPVEQRREVEERKQDVWLR